MFNEEISQKRPRKRGKRAEPTSGELEFIYESFARNRSDFEVVDDLPEKGYSIRRSIRFIKKRRREFDLVGKVLIRQSEGAFDPDEFKRKKRHQERLAERAQQILKYLKRYYPHMNDYRIGDCLVGSGDSAASSLLADYRSSCLLAHLKNEYPELSALLDWENLVISNIDKWDLMNILGKKADEAVFKGKCDLCKGWGLIKV